MEVEQRCRGGKAATVFNFQELQKMGEVLANRALQNSWLRYSIYHTVFLFKWANKVGISPKQILENWSLNLLRVTRSNFSFYSKWYKYLNNTGIWISAEHVTVFYNVFSNKYNKYGYANILVWEICNWQHNSIQGILHACKT